MGAKNKHKKYTLFEKQFKLLQNSCYKNQQE